MRSKLDASGRSGSGAMVTLVVALALSVTGPVLAHHSRSEIDETKRVTLTGTLIRVDWRNPHVEFSVEAKGEDGRVVSWSIESGAPSALALRKITKAMFAEAAGKAVSVEVSTARDGSPFGTCWKITFPNGSTHVMRQ